MNSNLKNQFIIEYFKEMRAEINLRIRTHTNYVAAKIVTCGALLSFLLTGQISPDLKLLGFPLIPIISMLYDVMIARNIRNIHKIALFIRDNLETQVSGIVFWEEFSGQKDPKVRNYGITDILFLSLFTVGTVLIPMIMCYLQKLFYPLMIIALFLSILLIFTIIYMYRCILYFLPPKEGPTSHNIS